MKMRLRTKTSLSSKEALSPRALASPSALFLSQAAALSLLSYPFQRVLLFSLIFASLARFSGVFVSGSRGSQGRQTGRRLGLAPRVHTRAIDIATKVHGAATTNHRPATHRHYLAGRGSSSRLQLASPRLRSARFGSARFHSHPEIFTLFSYSRGAPRVTLATHTSAPPPETPRVRGSALNIILSHPNRPSFFPSYLGKLLPVLTLRDPVSR